MFCFVKIGDLRVISLVNICSFVFTLLLLLSFVGFLFFGGKISSVDIKNCSYHNHKVLDISNSMEKIGSDPC